jgi:hypothetical protein
MSGEARMSREASVSKKQGGALLARRPALVQEATSNGYEATANDSERFSVGLTVPSTAGFS